LPFSAPGEIRGKAMTRRIAAGPISHGQHIQALSVTMIVFIGDNIASQKWRCFDVCLMTRI